MCIGGDATLSAAAAAAIRAGAAFVPVPNGFGNVFAQVFGYPARAREVVRLLDEGEVRAVDVGVVKREGGEELFLSHRSYGFLEHIQQVAERGRKQPRRRFLRHLYYYGVAHRFLFRTRLASFQVVVDGRPVADDAVLVTVANVETYRGFLALTPTASPIDGLFDVFVVPRVSKIGLLWRLLRVMFRLPGRWRGVALYRGRRVSGDDAVAPRRAARAPPGAAVAGAAGRPGGAAATHDRGRGRSAGREALSSGRRRGGGGPARRPPHAPASTARPMTIHTA